MSGCAGPKQAVITTYDRIYLPGEEVLLQAQLEKGTWLRSDIDKEKILFTKSGEKIGEAVTGDEGMAILTHPPLEEGFHQFEASVVSKKYNALPATMLVRVASPDTKFLVVDIDNTLSDISPILMIFSDNAKIPPLKGAPETLRRLSKDYTIIYLTGRDEALSPKTKRWLAENNFPPGPVFFWDFTHTPLSKRKYKSEFINMLGRKFQLVQIGIGNSLGDAFAYIDNSLQPFIILNEKEKKKRKKLPRGCTVIGSWNEIDTLLEPKKQVEEGPL